MNRLILLLLMFINLSGCATTVSRDLSIEEKNSEAVIRIQANERSYFDPDGFSRDYAPHIAIRLFGKGKRQSYRNVPGTTYRFGQDFSVDIDYCHAGFLWLSDDKRTLSVSLYDVIPPEQLSPLRSLSGVFNLSDADGAKLPH